MPIRNFTGTAYNSAADTLIEHVNSISSKVAAKNLSQPSKHAVYFLLTQENFMFFA